MIDLNSLRYHLDHPRRSVFLSCDWRACAREAGIRYGLFVDILNGDVEPTPDQDKRINHIADQIEVAEAIEQFV